MLCLASAKGPNLKGLVKVVLKFKMMLGFYQASTKGPRLNGLVKVVVVSNTFQLPQKHHFHQASTKGPILKGLARL